MISREAGQLVLVLLLALSSSCCLGEAQHEAQRGAAKELQQALLLHRTQHQQQAQGHERHLQASSKGAAAQPHVVIVNDIPGHFEVLAGVLAMTQAAGLNPDVLYTGNPSYPRTWGLWAWLGAPQLQAAHAPGHRRSLHSTITNPHSSSDMRNSSMNVSNISSSSDGAGGSAAGGAGRALRVAAPAAAAVPEPNQGWGTWVPRDPEAAAEAERLGQATATWLPLRTATEADNSLGAVRGRAGRHGSGAATLLVCISAELAPHVCRAVTEALQPSMLVLWVHRADTATPTSKILRLWPRYTLVALAPHVANLSSARMRQPVAWTLPVAPHVPLPGEPSCARKDCLDGFTIQGALRKYRSKVAAGFTRNYTALWERLGVLKAGRKAGAPPVRVAVLGKGLRSELGIPPELDADVEHLSRLPYPEFWGRIARSLALVPAFGMPVYYESRISSTITASLITCTPLLAEQKLLDTYTFLGPEHVFLRQPGEEEADAMYRVAALPEVQLLARRAALARLRDSLNARSLAALREWVAAAAEAARNTTPR